MEGKTMTLRKKLKTILNHIPLWMQLALFTTLITFLVLFYLIYTEYRRNLQVITNTQRDTSCRLLSMEMQDLETYVQELALFCIQSCYDHTFTRIVEKESPILPEEETYLRNQIKAYFYSRSDLERFDFYLMNHQWMYSRTREGIRKQNFLLRSVTDTDYYRECTSNSYFHAILPANEPDELFHYYHSLLRIRTKEPQALASVAVDDSYWRGLLKNHTNFGEFLCLFNADGLLLHADPGTPLADASPDILNEIYALSGQTSFYYTLDGQRYLVTCAEGASYQMRLMSFLPVSAIDSQIAQIRSSILWNGILISLAVLLLIAALIRLLTKPLTILANKLISVGNGDFTSSVDINGSLEISRLSQSFNEMTQHIDHLIKKTYVAELGEKTARITALEAQLNPHFLYNTLQAISTEALINDQMQIYDMITALASGLRYTIKGGDCVPLYQEMKYVENYIHLQKIRMEERLQVSFQIAPTTRDLIIPKISIQSLVENSILHGIGPERDSIAIEITNCIVDDYLQITVKDNGCGISSEHLDAILASFAGKTPTEKNHIGLANLYGRLHLLYHDKADLRIHTQYGSHTTITMILPASKEVPNV